MQTLKSIPLRTSAVDSYLEIICVYKKSDRRVIGSPLSLAKLVMHLMTSMPGNRAAFEEHARLLGYLAMQYMITNPQNTAEIQGAVKVALERLKDNITPASLLPLKLASLA